MSRGGPIPRFAAPWLQQVLPVAAKRLVVLDSGDRFLKLAVAECTFGRVRLVHVETIDLQGAGLSTEIDVRHHLETHYPELAAWPLALVVPQHRTISQLLDLPGVKPGEARAAVEAEAGKLSGWGGDAMRISYARLRPFAKYQNPHWLTLCKAEAIDEALDRYLHAFGEQEGGESGGALWEVLTSTQALLGLGQTVKALPRTAVFVDLRANYTNIALQFDGQAVFATSLPQGTEGLASVVAQSRGVDVATAESWLQSTNLLEGEAAVPALQARLDAWCADLKLVLREWLEDHPAFDFKLEDLPILVCGSGAEQPGLLDYLNRATTLRFQLLPTPPAALPAEASFSRYAVAYGAALQSLGRTRQPVSLLPAGFRPLHVKQRAWEVVQACLLLLLLVLTGVLAFGTWQQVRLSLAKHRLQSRTQKALEQALEIDATYRHLNAQYERVRPVLNRQRQSSEVLNALAAVQSVRTNNDFWYVLFADAASYAAGTTLPEVPTNRPTAGSLPVTPLVSAPAAPGAGDRREFIAEICIPQEGEAMRRILSQVVAELKRDPLFSRVDALPPERKRNLVDPRVVITNRFFALAMQTHGGDLPAAERLLLPDKATHATNAGPELRRPSGGQRLRPEGTALGTPTNRAGAGL